MIRPARASNPDSPITVAKQRVYRYATNSAIEAGWIFPYTGCTNVVATKAEVTREVEEFSRTVRRMAS